MEHPVYKKGIATEFKVVIEGIDIIIKNSEEKARIVYANEGWDFDYYEIKDRKEGTKLPRFVNFNGTWYFDDKED